jgi:hypothetical protein
MCEASALQPFTDAMSRKHKKHRHPHEVESHEEERPPQQDEGERKVEGGWNDDAAEPRAHWEVRPDDVDR